MSITKEDFIVRTVTFRDGDIAVHRTRNSAGNAWITVRISLPDLSSPVEFTFNSTGDGHYEAMAQKLAYLLNAAADESCALLKP